jgi:acyl-CoA synthetase (AMP-forming)/AMP-acid ligase II
LEHPDFTTTDLGSLREVTYGAAPASPELIRSAMTALPGVDFTNVFGQTETLGSITALGPADHAAGKLTSVGRPLPGVEVRVADPTTGASLAIGDVGELWVKTEANVAVADHRGSGLEDGWLRTGDMVSIDADGYLYPAGRLSDTINRGGEKFAPSEVADVVGTHGAVRDVAVGGYPDPEMGQRVGALVVADGEVTLTQLRAHCRGKVADFKLPEKLVLVEEIPYNDFGKVSRKALAELLTGP